jgi:hypothetical protein
MLATFACWYSTCCALTLLAPGQASSQQPDHDATIKRVCKPHLPDHIVSWDVLLMLLLADLHCMQQQSKALQAFTTVGILTTSYIYIYILSLSERG